MAGILSLLRTAGEALDYDMPRGPLSRAHPGILAVSTLLLWAGLSMAGSPWSILPGLAGALIFHAMSGKARARAAARASIYPALLVAGIGLLFAPMKPLSGEWAAYGLVIASRVYGMASTGILALGEAGPLGVQCVIARLSPLLHDSLVLMLRVSPQIVEDTLVGAWAQKLLGKPVREAMVGAALSGVRRAEEARAILYLRGAAPGRRSPLCGAYDTGITLLVLAIGLAGLAGAIL